MYCVAELEKAVHTGYADRIHEHIATAIQHMVLGSLGDGYLSSAAENVEAAVLQFYRSGATQVNYHSIFVDILKFSRWKATKEMTSAFAHML